VNTAMLRLGLTGGIASGKSAVAAMLREMGFAVIDADSLAHSLIEPEQPAYQEIVSTFGSSILDLQGRVDRTKLGAVVFADRAKLDTLNAIVHPRVRAAIAAQFAEWARAGARTAAFVEAALLVEAGYLEDLDGLVVTWSRPEQQIERLQARGMSEEEARQRSAAQMPVQEKLKFATERIDCSGSMEETRRQVALLARRVRAGCRSCEP
jgi:dephospho-CoA kinase